LKTRKKKGTDFGLLRKSVMPVYQGLAGKLNFSKKEDFLVTSF